MAGAHSSPAAALRRGLSRLWVNRDMVALVWGVQVGPMLVLLGALGALGGIGGGIGARPAGPAAVLLGSWWLGGAATSVAAGLGAPGIAAGLLWALLDFAAAGGVLTLLHTDPDRPRARELFRGCAVHLLRFARLFAVAAALCAIVLWLDGWAFDLLGGAGASGPLRRLRGAGTLATLAAAGLLFDLALIRTVLTGSRRPVRRLLRSAGFLARNLPRILLLYAVAVVPGVLLVGALLQARVPAGPPSVLALVLYGLARTVVRVLLWGGELSLYRGLRTRELSRRGSTA